MARKGNSRHMKALNSPRYQFIERKAHGAYVAKPAPGRHKLDRCITLKLFAVKSAVVVNGMEAAKAIKAGNLSVNGKIVKDPSYPIGMNDRIEVIPSKKTYVIGINERGQVSISALGKEEPHIYRINGKYRAGGNTLMFRLHDGSSVNAKKAAKVNDSIILGKERTIAEVVPLRVGAECVVIDGVHVGMKGKVTELKPGSMHSGASAVIEQRAGSKFETLVNNIMVIS
jgi:small subunit ribosomal protein S4e